MKDLGRLFDGLQFFAWLEADRSSGRNAYFRAGPWVAPDAGLPRTHVEHAKAAQLNAFTLCHGLLHAREHGFYGEFSFGFGDAGFGYDFIYDIGLNQWRAPQKIRNR